MWYMEVTMISIIIGAPCTNALVTVQSHQTIGTWTGGLGNNETVGECPNYYIVEVSKITEKSPGDFMRLAVS